MANKQVLGKVSIPSNMAKWFKYVAKDGTVFAVEPGRTVLSDAEKASREAERKKKKSAVTKQRAAYRSKMQDAKARVKKDPSVANAEAFEKAKQEYDSIMGK